MIKVSPVFGGRICNCCHDDKNVADISISNDETNQGTIIALCRACRKKLEIELLKYKVAERAKG